MSQIINIQELTKLLADKPVLFIGKPFFIDLNSVIPGHFSIESRHFREGLNP
jgi:hypothetical protein